MDFVSTSVAMVPNLIDSCLQIDEKTMRVMNLCHQHVLREVFVVDFACPLFVQHTAEAVTVSAYEGVAYQTL